MRERVETIVIGAGQAGLAVSHLLSQAAREHLVVDRAGAANSWRDKRWDSFHLVIPNRYWCMPGMVYDGAQPDGFMAKQDVVARFERYLAEQKPPLLENTAVIRVSSPGPRQFVVHTGQAVLRSANVVVATGPFQAPAQPAWCSSLHPAIVQLHSQYYRNPSQLPPGATLVTGSGQSGVQIAEELLRAGRRVYLCAGSRGWLPRRYLGKDITTWYVEMGLFDTPIDEFPSLAAARASGFAQLAGDTGLGHDLNVHTLAQAGAILLGRALDGAGSELRLADLEPSLDATDAFAARAKQLIDQHILKEREQVSAPRTGEEAWPVYRRARDSAPTTIDLHREGIRSIVWAGGYRPDFGFLDLPVVDGRGYPLHRKGITEVPGLYFIGLEWLHRRKSSTLMAGEEDAARIVAAIAGSQVHR